MGDYYWVALYVKSRAEKKVAGCLQQMGINHYLPLMKTKVQWSDRKKVVEKVLLPGYVFVYLSEKEYYDVLNVNGAVTYVRSEGKAARIPEKQINAMKLLLQHSSDVKIEDISIQKGQNVTIAYGAFKGFSGEVLETKNNNKLIVRIVEIGICLTLEVPISHVQSQ